MLIGAYHYARYDLHSGTNAGANSEATTSGMSLKNYIIGGGYYLMQMLNVEASPSWPHQNHPFPMGQPMVQQSREPRRRQRRLRSSR